MMFDLRKWLFAAIHWSERTFGPGHRPYRNVDHILKEVREVIREPKSLEEWVDIAMLATDGAMRAGFTPEHIARQLENKLAINNARKWPDWRTADPTKAIEHVRDGEPPTLRLKLRRDIPGLGYNVECKTCGQTHEIHPYMTSHHEGHALRMSWKQFQRFVCPTCHEDAVYQIVGHFLYIRWDRRSDDKDKAIPLEQWNVSNELGGRRDNEDSAAGVSGGAVDDAGVRPFEDDVNYTGEPDDAGADDSE